MKCRTTNSPRLTPILETRSTLTPHHTTCGPHPKFSQVTQTNIQAHPKTTERRHWTSEPPSIHHMQICRNLDSHLLFLTWFYRSTTPARIARSGRLSWEQHISWQEEQIDRWLGSSSFTPPAALPCTLEKQQGKPQRGGKWQMINSP